MTDEPLAWAVLLSDGRLYGRYDFQWEARAIADALLATDGVPATVEPLYRSPTLTDAEREAVERVRRGIAVSGKTFRDMDHKDMTMQQMEDYEAICGLLERTRGS